MIINKRLKHLLYNKINYYIFLCLFLLIFVVLSSLPKTCNNKIIEYYNDFFAMYSVTFILIPLFLIFFIYNDYIYENTMAIVRFKNKKTLIFNRAITLLLDSIIFLIACLLTFFIFCMIWCVKGITLNFLLHLFITSILHWLGLSLFGLVFYTARYVFKSRLTGFCIILSLFVIEFLSFTGLIPVKISIVLNSSFIAGLLSENGVYSLALHYAIDLFLKIVVLFCIGLFFIDNMELKENCNEAK